MRDDELRRLFQMFGDPVADAVNPPTPAQIRHRGQRRRRRVALASTMAVLIVAAAGVGVVQARNLSRTSPTHPGPEPAVTSASVPLTTSPPAPPTSGATGQATTATTLPLGTVGELHAIQFVSATQGWAAGRGAILVTSDGGQHWGRQYGGNANLLTIDFFDARHGWAVATDPAPTLLGTSDGGQHWRALGEPSGGTLGKVHFDTASQGFGVAARNSSPRDTRLVATGDGGATWRWLPTPSGAGAGTVVSDVCFSHPGDGWLVTSSSTGAGGTVWRSAGASSGLTIAWHRSYQLNTGGDPVTGAQLQCAGPGSAWVQVAGGGAAGHIAYVLLNTRNGGTTWKAVLVNQFTWRLLFPGVPDGPGSYPGPFSAVSPTAAFALGSTPPAGDLLSGMLATAGATPGPARKVPALSAMRTPQGVSFVSATAGWVAGTDSKGHGVILATADGGQSWKAQLS